MRGWTRFIKAFRWEYRRGFRAKGQIVDSAGKLDLWIFLLYR